MNLKDRVFKDKNGALGWKREDLSEALDAYAAKGNIVTAIDLYVLEKTGAFSNIIKTNLIVDDSRLMTPVWYAKDRMENEQDSEFAQRAKKELLDQIEKSDYLDRAREEDKEKLYFHFYTEIKFETS